MMMGTLKPLMHSVAYQIRLSMDSLLNYLALKFSNKNKLVLRYVVIKMTNIQCSELPNTQWSELPNDVLGLILSKLNLPDYFRCSAVCISWRRAVAQRLHPPKNELPWVMVSEEVKGEIRRLVSPYDGKIYRMNQPEFDNCRCCGSFEGWLVMVATLADGFPRNFLFNPFSRAKIHLPSQTTIPFPRSVHSSRLVNILVDFAGEERICCDKHLICKAILSSAPTPGNIDTGSCIVVGIIQCWDSRRLVFCRPGDETWSTLKVEDEEYDISYKDIVYYNGKFFAVDGMDRLAVCEFGPHPKIIRIDVPPCAAHHTCTEKYLAESSGELLLITKHLPDRVDHTRQLFQLFKFDASATRWVEVERLGDCALFLGGNQSISLTASQYPGLIRGNCIYYTTVFIVQRPPTYVGRSHDSRMFCLDDGSLKPHVTIAFEPMRSHALIFITPNPC